MIEGQVLGRAVVRAAEALGLRPLDLGAAIGLKPPAVGRLRRDEEMLKRGTKPFELAVLLVRLHRSLDAITGSDDAVARAWLRNENVALGARPIETIRTVAGLVEATAYLDARRAVV